LDGESHEAQLLREAWNSAVTSRWSFVVTTRPDMSMAAAPNADYSVVVRFQLKSGMDARFAALWNETILPALSASGNQRTAVFQTVQGGLSGEYFAITPLTNMTALDGPGRFSSLSPQEAAALIAEVGEFLVEFETNIVRTEHDHKLWLTWFAALEVLAPTVRMEGLKIDLSILHYPSLRHLESILDSESDFSFRLPPEFHPLKTVI
jgi:hypothetical protein